MIAILGDFRSFTYFDETCLTDKNGDHFFSFGIDLLRHDMGVGDHVETVRDHETRAAKNRGRTACFLKRANRDYCRFDLLDDVRKCGRVSRQSTKRRQEKEPHAAETSD